MPTLAVGMLVGPLIISSANTSDSHRGQSKPARFAAR